MGVKCDKALAQSMLSLAHCCLFYYRSSKGFAAAGGFLKGFFGHALCLCTLLPLPVCCSVIQYQGEVFYLLLLKRMHFTKVLL